jgi:hypothetical protein
MTISRSPMLSAARRIFRCSTGASWRHVTDGTSAASPHIPYTMLKRSERMRRCRMPISRSEASAMSIIGLGPQMKYS